MAETAQRLRELPDPELVERFRKGRSSAFRELVRRYQSKVYALALRLTSNQADAQEVLQDSFLSVYRKIDTFRGDSAFSSWLYRITANAALMKIRSRGTRRDVALDDVLPAIESQAYFPTLSRDWSEDAERVVLNRELADRISSAVEKLPEKYRVVFLLREVEGLPTQEVADALGLSTPTVKTRLHRARLFLRQELDRTFSSLPAESLTLRSREEALSAEEEE
jgi:RNA polymerase sigma-70 factor (ECF subfamily)